MSYLHLNVQQDGVALLGLLLDGHLAGTIAVAAEHGVLDEAILGDEVLELGHGDVVVVYAILLALARGTGGVGDGEGEAVGVVLAQAVVESALADARGARDDNRAAVEESCRMGQWARRYSPEAVAYR